MNFQTLTFNTSQNPAHHINDIIDIFNSCFKNSHNTILVAGEDEPIYLPAQTSDEHHKIIFANYFYSSALHEISHWLVAGSERHKLIDFGYWYCPDGRDQQTQAEFETLEVAPQSFEWMLSVAAGLPFQVSCDNLNGDFEPDHRAFRQRVKVKVIERLSKPLPERTQKLLNALHDFYATPKLSPDLFI